jgi:hypothetical protein
MRLYFSIVASIIAVLGTIAGTQLLLSANDFLYVALGCMTLVLTPVLGYYVCKWVGNEYIAFVTKRSSNGHQK